MLSLAIIIIFFVFLNKSKQYALFFLIAWHASLSMVLLFGKWNAAALLINILFFSVFLQKKLRTGLFKYPFLISLLFAWSSYIISWMIGKGMHLGSIFMLNSYFMLPLLTWVLYKPSKESSQTFKKMLKVYLVILVIYGIKESLTAQNPIVSFLRSHDLFALSAEQRTDYERFGFYRSQSLTMWCSSFGFTCGAAAAYLLYSYMSKIFKDNISTVIVVVLSLLGVFFCGTRSVFVSVFVIFLSITKYFKHIKWIMSVSLVCFLAYMVFGEILNDVLDSIIHHEDAGGSSIELRLVQYAAAYNFFIKNPIFGGGMNAVSVAMDQDSDLYGAESIIFTTLIGRGLFGIVTLFAMWLHPVLYMLKRKEFFLIFFVLGMALAKILSSIVGVPETFIFTFLIILLKDKEYQSIKRSIAK